MSKKENIKKETPKKERSLVQKVFGLGKDKDEEKEGKTPEEEKPEPKSEEFKEAPPKPTGNAFKDAIAMSAWRTKKNQHNFAARAKQKEENEKQFRSSIKFDKDGATEAGAGETGRDEGSSGSGD